MSDYRRQIAEEAMFLGHFGLGLAGKRLAPGVSLGTLFLAVQWADLLFFVLAAAGLEHFRIAPGATRVTPMDFYDYPWSHSLLALAVWGLALRPVGLVDRPAPDYGCRMKFSVEVPYGDIDAMGHLNNVAYLRYLEWARSKYWLAMRGSMDFLDIDFVVARAEIDYRSSVHMGEVLEIDVRVPRMGKSSFDFSYRVTGADGRLVAEATTTQVCYDWRERRKTALTPERRREIEAFEAGPQ